MVLHTHIPYCRKAGVWPFGEEWIHEALSETYIPLLNVLYNLVEEGYKPYITINLTPILVEQLSDNYFNEKFKKYVENKVELAERDINRFNKKGEKEYEHTARFYLNWYEKIYRDYRERFNENVIGAFGKLQREGYIEIITSAATHGYLPLLGRDSSIFAQINIGKETYQRYFDKRPKGIWLPECAYRPTYNWLPPVDTHDAQSGLRPGIEKFLIENDISYFFVDTHVLEGGEPKGVYMERFPALKRLWQQFEKEYKKTDRKVERRTAFLSYLLQYREDFVNVLARNKETGLQVWSGDWGYPGDFWYREFHKKDEISGFQYWRVTDPSGDLATKEVYIPERVSERVKEQADHFSGLVYNLLSDFYAEYEVPGVINALYDTELFGHWWFEGVKWIGEVLKNISKIEDIALSTSANYIENYSSPEVISIPEGSWGEGGHHFVWLNEKTEWLWPIIYRAEKRMEDTAVKYRDNKDPIIERMLNQAARELLLLESSDWPFLITTMQAAEYASNRFKNHVNKFNTLLDFVEGKKFDEEAIFYLTEIEDEDNPFSFINFRVYNYNNKKE